MQQTAHPCEANVAQRGAQGCHEAVVAEGRCSTGRANGSCHEGLSNAAQAAPLAVGPGPIGQASRRHTPAGKVAQRDSAAGLSAQG